MALNTKISRDVGNGYVQVDISSKNEAPSYYIMPKNKTDSFILQYKKDRKNNSILRNITFVGSLIFGSAVMLKLLKNLNTNSILKGLLNICATVPFTLFSLNVCDNYIQSKRDELMKSHNAKQIFYNV